MVVNRDDVVKTPRALAIDRQTEDKSRWDEYKRQVGTHGGREEEETGITSTRSLEERRKQRLSISKDPLCYSEASRHGAVLYCAAPPSVDSWSSVRSQVAPR